MGGKGVGEISKNARKKDPNVVADIEHGSGDSQGKCSRIEAKR